MSHQHTARKSNVRGCTCRACTFFPLGVLAFGVDPLPAPPPFPALDAGGLPPPGVVLGFEVLGPPVAADFEPADVALGVEGLLDPGVALPEGDLDDAPPLAADDDEGLFLDFPAEAFVPPPALDAPATPALPPAAAAALAEDAFGLGDDFFPLAFLVGGRAPDPPAPPLPALPQAGETNATHAHSKTQPKPSTARQ